MNVTIREESTPVLARVIITGGWNGSVEVAKELLEKICEKWPKGKKVKFLITCGGFVNFEWPASLSYSDIGDNKNPNSQAIKVLVEEAKKYCERLLNGELYQKLRKCADYLTLGVDSFKAKISLTKTYFSEPLIELVFLVD